MSGPQPSSAHHSPPSAPHLRRLAERLVRANLPGGHLVHLRSAIEGRLHVLALADLQPGAAHPLDVLVGFTAPPGWSALGIAVGGTAHHLAPSPAGAGQAAPTAERPFRVHLATIVSRDGAQGSAMATADQVCLPPLGSQPVEGLVGDALRRCLALPTPPPDAPPSVWVTCRWLDALTAGATPGAALAAGPTAALALHPLATGTVGQPTATSLRTAAQRLDAAGWEALRQAAVRTPAPSRVLALAAAPVAPAIARWADAGCLARLLEAGLPPLGFLLDAAAALLPREVCAQVLPVARAAG